MTRQPLQGKMRAWKSPQGLGLEHADLVLSSGCFLTQEEEFLIPCGHIYRALRGVENQCFPCPRRLEGLGVGLSTACLLCAISHRRNARGPECPTAPLRSSLRAEREPFGCRPFLSRSWERKGRPGRSVSVTEAKGCHPRGPHPVACRTALLFIVQAHCGAHSLLSKPRVAPIPCSPGVQEASNCRPSAWKRRRPKGNLF